MTNELVDRLLREARSARGVQAFWQSAADGLSAWGNGMRVTITYVGRTEQGSVEAGAPSGGGERGVPLTLRREDEGRRVSAVFDTLPSGRSRAEAESALEVAARLALLVGQRARLERDQQLGSFVVELSRWLLAAPERDLMLRYTLQSVMKLYAAEGAFAALREPGHEAVRVVTALGSSVEMQDMLLPLQGSTTGRVVRQGEAVATDNIREEPDVYLAANPTGTARAAMIAPLHSSGGTLGAIAIVRFRRAGATKDPPTFSLADLHFFTAVAAHVAGGLELAHVVETAREAADRAAAMVSASPLPLALVDREGHVHLLNEAGRVVFGLDAATGAVGRLLDELGLDVGEGGLARALARRPGSEPWRGMVKVSRPGDAAERTCDCTITSLEGLGSTDLLVALHDRTEELRAQREMIAREKLATVGELAGGVAHEVNNPLTAIRMEAELLQRAKKDAETDAAAGTIVREVDRASRIVRSLLRLARRADTTPVPVQLNDVVADVAEIRRRVLKSENVDLTIETDHAAPAVLGLGQELLQVVINLVANAEYAVRGRERAVISVATQARPGWVRLAVDDSGPGVPAAVRHRIFDPFFTTKNPDEGSGLGLAICQRTVSEVGGKIWLEDSRLGGARFVVDLPAAPDWAGR